MVLRKCGLNQRASRLKLRHCNVADVSEAGRLRDRLRRDRAVCAAAEHEVTLKVLMSEAQRKATGRPSPPTAPPAAAPSSPPPASTPPPPAAAPSVSSVEPAAGTAGKIPAFLLAGTRWDPQAAERKPLLGGRREARRGGGGAGAAGHAARPPPPPSLSAAPSPPAIPRAARAKGWRRAIDIESGDAYYWNERTLDVLWELPGDTLPAPPPPPAAAPAGPPSAIARGAPGPAPPEAPMPSPTKAPRRARSAAGRAAAISLRPPSDGDDDGDGGKARPHGGRLGGKGMQPALGAGFSVLAALALVA